VQLSLFTVSEVLLAWERQRLQQQYGDEYLVLLQMLKARPDIIARAR
jgi:hypothetical protein